MQREQALAAEDRQHVEILERLRLEQPDKDWDQAELVAVPAGLTRTQMITAHRRLAYEKHLCAILREAASVEPETTEGTDPPMRAAVQRLCDTACMQCKGGCCATGGDHAYLSAETMRRELDRGVDAAALRKRYMAQVPARAIQGGCINQTETGCALPREQRSELCNTYYCGPVQDLRDRLAAAPDPSCTVLVQRAHTTRRRFDPDADHDIIAIEVLAPA
ncbi:MAG: hypothetical protein PF961_22215 [Planctomycetota bacterium]|jgi:hypothetical protein|nr:hypothetical protein [Planctomycetota bacterium]